MGLLSHAECGLLRTLGKGAEEGWGLIGCACVGGGDREVVEGWVVITLHQLRKEKRP